MNAPAPQPSLAGLNIGDRVVVKRNIDHPVHMKQIAADPRSGSDTQWVRDEDIVELIGDALVIELRHIPAIPGAWRPREEKNLARLGSGFWYDLATGLQDGSGATLIERKG